MGGEIDGDTITLFFSEPLDETTGGQGDDYRINLQWGSLLGNAPHHGRCRSEGTYISFTTKPREVYVEGSTVVVVGLNEDPRYRAGVGQNVNNFHYRANTDMPANQRLRDLSGNPVYTPNYDWDANWSTHRIDLPSVTRLPFPESATVVGKKLILTFNAPMDESSKSVASAFTVTVNGSAVSLADANPVAVSGETVTLTLASSVAQGADVMVSYDKPSSSPLQNVICEDAPSFTDEPVIAANLTGLVPTVSGVVVTSDPGDNNTYRLGDTIEVAVTFSAAVNVATKGGTPRLKIRIDPHQWWVTTDDQGRWANYDRGSGTNTLTFAYTVAEPNISLRGIAVIGNSLELNGGRIRLMSDQTISARLTHTGQPHNPSHKVDWRLPPPGVPQATGLAITSNAGDDDTYVIGDTIQVEVTFSEAMNVTGTPRLKIKMDPEWGEFWADYIGGTGMTTLTFTYTVAEPNTSPQGIAVLAHSLDLNGGTSGRWRPGTMPTWAIWGWATTRATRWTGSADGQEKG